MELLKVFGVSIFSFSLVACGGGSGDSVTGDTGVDSSSQQPAYQGSTDYAALNLEQCSSYKLALFGDSGLLGLANNFSAENIIPENNSGNETIAGRFGGSLTTSSSFATDNTGWMQADFDQYQEQEGLEVNGAFKIEQDAYRNYYEYHMLISFFELSISYADVTDITTNGTFEIDRMNPESYVESDTLNILISDNISGVQVAAEDLVINSYEGNQFDISGTIMVSEFGKVDLYNVGGVYTDDGYSFSGGEVIASGGDSKCRYTYVSDSQVTVEIDADNDDVYEDSSVETWY